MRKLSVRRGSLLAVSTRRRWMVGGLLALAGAAVPIGSLAAAEPGSRAFAGTSVRGVAAEGSGSVIAAGRSGSSMLVQRFDAGGSPGTAFSAGSGEARAVAVQPDGKIVVAGNDSGMVVRRFNADGTPDASFGTGGTARAAATAANAVAIGPCGTIVAGGLTSDAGDGFSRIALARWTASGALDPSFGSNGVAVIDLGTGSLVNGIAVQSDGKVVFAGEQRPGLQVTNALIGRVNPGGGMDASFAGGGVFFYYHPGGGAASLFNSVAIDASGNIVGAGIDRRENDSHALFVRLTSGGGVDSSFGSGGFLTPSASSSSPLTVGPRSVAIAGGGRIVAVGASQSSGLRSAGVWVISPAGQLESFSSTAEQDARAVAVTPDGSLFVGGETVNILAPTQTQGFVTRQDGFGARPSIAGPGCGGPPPPPPPPPPGPPPPPPPPPPPGIVPPPPPPPPGIVPPPPPPPPVATAARLTRTSLSPRAIGPRTRAKLRFTLSRAVRVKLTVEIRRRGGRYVRLKGFRFVRAKAGANTVTITRRFAGRTLRPGSYRLVVRATGGGNTRKITFRVTR